MPEWVFPARPTVEEAERRRAELAREGGRVVPNQHIVSKAVLKNFSEKDSKGGHFLVPYNVRSGLELRPLGVKGCGKIRNFVRYASASLEYLWKSTVEDHLHDAVQAIHDGSILNEPRLIKVMKDCIALHLVRSPWYLALHDKIVEQATTEGREWILRAYGPRLERAFFARYGLHAAGNEALGAFLDENMANWRDLRASGLLERQSVEEHFEMARGTFDPLQIQLLFAPSSHEFVIADSPAFTYSFDHDKEVFTNIRKAIGDSNGAGMPITNRCYVVTAPDAVSATVSHRLLDALNRTQVKAAHEHVYYRPGSNLKEFVASARVDSQSEMPSNAEVTSPPSGPTS
ncbi:hypothetical protein JOD54_001942 [Actinokineospora baliensis]|uniref:DUF4238 domain-containing protein n=1 Tax=Actinokineospora baliensis TaxID=547056 RepID=UPI001959E0AE|nr:DUF4238 domain-containing protein [Actinokineospora baliensis]MBM7771738.1 hypothetical protein [Actinokineospora baliensis]